MPWQRGWHACQAAGGGVFISSSTVTPGLYQRASVSIIESLQIVAEAFFKIEKLLAPGNMRTSGRAVGNAAKDRKRKAETDSDSSVCDDYVVEQSRTKSKSIEKEILKEREARKKLQRELNEIRAWNEAARAEVVSARNDYPVLFVNVNGLLVSV